MAVSNSEVLNEEAIIAKHLFDYCTDFADDMQIVAANSQNSPVYFNKIYINGLHHAVVMKLLHEKSTNDTGAKSALKAYLDLVMIYFRDDEIELFERAVEDVLMIPIVDWTKSIVGHMTGSNSFNSKLIDIYEYIMHHQRKMEKEIVSKLGLIVLVTLENFDEKSYLASNTDVDGCVKSGQFQSGFEHFREWGMREGRTMKLL